MRNKDCFATCWHDYFDIETGKTLKQSFDSSIPGLNDRVFYLPWTSQFIPAMDSLDKQKVIESLADLIQQYHDLKEDSVFDEKKNLRIKMREIEKQIAALKSPADGELLWRVFNPSKFKGEILNLLYGKI